MKRGPTVQNYDEVARIRQKELEALDRDELVRHILRLEGLLNGETMRFRRPLGLRPFDYPWKPKEYVRLPVTSGRGAHVGLRPLWRVMLVSFDLAHPIIGLDICGDVVIGRGSDRDGVDLNLAVYDADEYGVSRRQALLHPTRQAVQLIDLNSKNGTRRSGARIDPGEAYALEHNDIIEFGGLQFQFRIINTPESPPCD